MGFSTTPPPRKKCGSSSLKKENTQTLTFCRGGRCSSKAIWSQQPIRIHRGWPHGHQGILQQGLREASLQQPSYVDEISKETNRNQECVFFCFSVYAPTATGLLKSYKFFYLPRARWTRTPCGAPTGCVQCWRSTPGGPSPWSRSAPPIRGWRGMGNPNCFLGSTLGLWRANAVGGGAGNVAFGFNLSTILESIFEPLGHGGALSSLRKGNLCLQEHPKRDGFPLGSGENSQSTSSKTHFLLCSFLGWF